LRKLPGLFTYIYQSRQSLYCFSTKIFVFLSNNVFGDNSEGT